MKDGIDTGYVGWNPESDMGNIEVWEQGIPMLYLGRSISANSGGAGRNRGGTAFSSMWLVHNTDQLTIATSEHSSRVFDNAGMCGGYPAPTAHPHFAVRNTNVEQLVEEAKPLPHSLGSNPHKTDLEKYVDGDLEHVEGPYINKPFESGDLFAHTYNGGGGYGDPIERDPFEIARDVENGYVTADLASNAHAVVGDYAEDKNKSHVDMDATKKRREEVRTAGLSNATPAEEWITSERERVLEKDFAPEIKNMYKATMSLSDQFDKEFKEFWNLPKDFTM